MPRSVDPGCGVRGRRRRRLGDRSRWRSLRGRRLRLRGPHRCGVDANNIPALEVVDLVFSLSLSLLLSSLLLSLSLSLSLSPLSLSSLSLSLSFLSPLAPWSRGALARDSPLDPGRALAQRVLDLNCPITSLRAHQYCASVVCVRRPTNARYVACSRPPTHQNSLCAASGAGARW